MPLPPAFSRWLAPLQERYERHARRIPAVMSLVLVVLLARTAADLVWLLVPQPEAAAWRPVPPAGAAAASERAAGPDLNAILNAKLFGDFRKPEVTPADLSQAPDTSLNLTLMGILAGTRERESRALIAGGNGVEEPYAVGDDVARGVQLQAIFPDRVILARDGRLETLRLDRDKPGSGGAAAAAYQASSADDEDEREVADATPSLGQIRDQVLKDPAKASEFIRVQPANVGGQLKGYRIYPGRDRAIFAAAGLRPGDLVTSVNGVELNDPARALQLLGELSQVGQVNLTVERAGQPQTINVTLN